MSWLFEKRPIRSAVNRELFLVRRFGRWAVINGAYDYTSPYLYDMWRAVLRRFIPRSTRARITRVLMFGLGGGGEIRTFHAFFPNCNVTAVEYDPEMVRIAREIKLYVPHPFPRVLVEDAATAVRSLTGPYDLIIMDMYIKDVPSPLMADRDFLQAVDGLLAPGGYVIANIFNKPPSFLHHADELFADPQYWTYRVSRLGIFKKKDVGS
jgi:spermidine synthase